jgi:hypothetical protein
MHCTAFAGTRRVASGPVVEVALAAKGAVENGEESPILIFDDETCRPIEIDFRGSKDDVRARLTAEETPRGPGRPRLGVVAREVTLLPRHWEWLNRQPGGASAALRRLVDEARRANEEKDRVREAREAAYRFMSAMAGNEPGFEEASRALFAGKAEGFRLQTEGWPTDVREHARMLAERGWAGEAPS